MSKQHHKPVNPVSSSRSAPAASLSKPVQNERPAAALDVRAEIDKRLRLRMIAEAAGDLDDMDYSAAPAQGPLEKTQESKKPKH